MVLCIDPGHTTGVALVLANGDLHLAFELSGDTGTVTSALSLIAEEHSPEDVVIEQGPRTRDNVYMEDLDARLRAQFPDATWLRPVDYKNTPRAQLPINHPSPHVKDAVRMGREINHRLRRRGV